MMLFRPSATSRILRMVSSGLAAAAVLVGTAALAAAQTPSLADIARKEQERRKKVPPPQKVYTNKDLPTTPEPPAPTAESPAAPTPIPQEAPVATERRTDEKDEAWWRARITSAREELRRNEVFLEALQSRVNALSADFVNRDDPYQRAKIGEDRQKTLAEMDRVKREIDEGQKLIENIEEEARKAGVPPGWLR